MNILITGMSGLIGSAARRRLASRGRLSALNRSDVDGVPTTRADLSDYEAIRPAFDGQDVVIHLAAKPGNHYPWEELLHTNIAGTRNVLEAARDAGCHRLIFASSGATVTGWEHDEPYKALVEARYSDVPETWPMIRHDMPTRPRGAYGATKVWGEAYCREIADSSSMSTLCLRIGFVNAEDRPVHPRHYAVWCSQRDVAEAIALAVDAPSELRYDQIFVNSRNRWGYRDLTHTEAVMGFVPKDTAEEHR